LINSNHYTMALYGTTCPIQSLQAEKKGSRLHVERWMLTQIIGGEKDIFFSKELLSYLISLRFCLSNQRSWHCVITRPPSPIKYSYTLVSPQYSTIIDHLFLEPMSTPVKLYVYDLSNGMAKQLSRQLTGRQIEGLWFVRFSMKVMGRKT
jgi:hypothetical protein